MLKRPTICLEYGDHGKDVWEAQKCLQKFGSKIQLTGKFTIGMRTAVKAFQRKHGLKETGIVNATTWEKLHARPSMKKTGGKKK